MSVASYPYLLWQERVAREGAKVGDYVRWLAVQYADFTQERQKGARGYVSAERAAARDDGPFRVWLRQKFARAA